LALRTIVFLGSVRNSTPPKPARLGERVARYCFNSLAQLGNDVVLVDPIELDIRPENSARTFKPQFSYARGKAPSDLDSLAEQISGADAFVMVSPEYNHSMSPALADLLNHFGSSLFSYKPSSIVTYSAGQWGGARAAVNMRTYLSELGCLPVSAMIHIPKVQEVFQPEGEISPDQDAASWEEYFPRTWMQMQWWGEAAKNHRNDVAPDALVKPFLKNPSQRNAGKSSS
jgi:chromate reductase